MEVGVPGLMEAVVRPVVVEHRKEPDHVTTQHQIIMERTAWGLMLQTDNVIHNPVQVIFIVTKSSVNYNVDSATNGIYLITMN